jgi:hypothetical protein
MSKKSRLKEILEEIAQEQKVLDKDISGYNPMTRSGLEQAKNQARQKIDKLKAEYLDTVRQGIYLVCLAGDPVKVAEMAEIARDDDQVVVDVGEPYRDVASYVNGMIDKKTRLFGAGQLGAISDRAYDWAEKLEIFAYPGPTLESTLLGSTVPTAEDTARLTDLVLWNMFGVHLIGQILKREATRIALEQEHDLAVLPVFVHGIPVGRETEVAERCFDGHGQVVTFDDSLSPSETLLKTIYAGIKRYMTDVFRTSRK